MATNKFVPCELVLVDWEGSFWPSRITQFHRSKDWRYVEYFGGSGYSGGIGPDSYFAGKAPLSLLHAYDEETKENLDKFISKAKLDEDPMLRAAVLQINEMFSEKATNNNYGLSQEKTSKCLCRLCFKSAGDQKEKHVNRNVEESSHADDSSDEEFFTPNTSITSIEELEIVSNADEDLEKLCEIFDSVDLDDGESGGVNRASHSDEALLKEDSDEYAELDDLNTEENGVANEDSDSQHSLEEQAHAVYTEHKDSNDDESGVETILQQDNDDYAEDENRNTGTIQPYPLNEFDNVFQENNNEKKSEDCTEILGENNNDLVDLSKKLEKVQIDETSHFLRRSTRRTESELLKEESEKIREHLRKDNDDGLGLIVSEIPQKGRGVVTSRDMKKGEFVVEHAGKLISIQSAKEREEEYGVENGMACYMFYFEHQGKKLCIDETEETGRLGRLLNHSRQHPNLDTKVMEVDGTPRLYMVAKEDIKAGDELVFDYGEKRKDVIEANPWLAL